MTYAKFKDGEAYDFRTDRGILEYKGRKVINPRPIDLFRAGYLKVVESEIPDGKIVSGHRLGLSKEAGGLAILQVLSPEPARVRIFSKEKCRRELEAVGKWDEVKTLLQAEGYWDSFVLSSYLKEDDPVFKACLVVCRTALGMDDAAIESFLSKVEDV